MKFTLEIGLGNDAMRTTDDVAHELYRLSKKMIGTEPLEVGQRGEILTTYDERVGNWAVVANWSV